MATSKKKTPAQRGNKVVCFEIPKGDYRRMKALCKRRRVLVSAAIRSAIIDWTTKEGAK